MRRLARLSAGAGEIGGSGGLVAVDRKGNVSLPFLLSMYRAWCGLDGEINTGIYR